MKNVPNKAITNSDVIEHDFHFAGAGRHAPVTIKAKTVQEAEHKLTELINSSAPPMGKYEEEEKVESKKVLSDEK